MEGGFVISDDKTADWAISTIKETEEERDRLIKLAQDQINDLTAKIEYLKEKCDNDTEYLRSCLSTYFNTVKSKETKTQKTYKLLSGTLVYKKPSIRIIHNDEKLISYLKENDGTDFIKIKESVDWTEFKKGLIVSDDGEIVDKDLGIVIDKSVCSVEDVPASFNIKY